MNKNSTMIDLPKHIKEACYLQGSFTLRSGLTTSEYFDKYLFESNPDLLAKTTNEMLDLIPKETQVLAGLEMGGIPIATLLSHYSKLPVVFVRKKAKQYGTSKLAEGIDIKNKNVLIVEDVVTTGGQIGLSANDLRTLGAHVNHALCVIDREQNGYETLKTNHDIHLISLYKKRDFS